MGQSDLAIIYTFPLSQIVLLDFNFLYKFHGCLPFWIKNKLELHRLIHWTLARKTVKTMRFSFFPDPCVPSPYGKCEDFFTLNNPLAFRNNSFLECQSLINFRRGILDFTSRQLMVNPRRRGFLLEIWGQTL